MAQKLALVLPDSTVVKSGVPIGPSRILMDPTGILSRGVNIASLDIGISIGFPESKETILHQWGRVGREGKGGGKFFMILESPEDEIQQLEYLQFQLGVCLEEWSSPGGHPFQICPTVDGRMHAIQNLVSRYLAN